MFPFHISTYVVRLPRLINIHDLFHHMKPGPTRNLITAKLQFKTLKKDTGHITFNLITEEIRTLVSGTHP